MVYRAVDLGATGRPEVITALRWRPLGPVVDDAFERVTIDVGHSIVVPDYTVGSFSALPLFPQSGLSTTFASNQKLGETPVRVYDGGYSIRASALRPDGYLSYPAPQQPFDYNGINSLLLDVRTSPSATASGQNGQEVYLMVQSSPNPNSRVVEAGSASNPVDPFAATTGSIADNAVHALQIDFAQVKSVATSPWRMAPVAAPDYHAPSIAASGEVRVEFRGARSASGANATPWTTSIDLLDFFPYLQYRVTMCADATTGLPAAIDAIVIPVN